MVIFNVNFYLSFMCRTLATHPTIPIGNELSANCCFGTWPVSLHLSIVDGHKTAFSCSDEEEGIALFEDISIDTSEEVRE